MGTGPLGSIALAWAWILTYCASLLVSLVLRLIIRVMLHLLKVSADQDAETVTITSIGVIALSDNSIVDQWRVWNIKLQPQVWIAIFSTITNAMLGFALIEGLTIHFWKRAGRGMAVGQKLSFFFVHAALISN